jgi:hypothetical protein
MPSQVKVEIHVASELDDRPHDAQTPTAPCTRF